MATDKTEDLKAVDGRTAARTEALHQGRVKTLSILYNYYNFFLTNHPSWSRMEAEYLRLRDIDATHY